MTLLTYVEGEDWIGLYIDSKLQYEGHDMHHKALIELVIKFSVDRVEFKDANLKWLANVGDLPNNLNEVKFKD